MGVARHVPPFSEFALSLTVLSEMFWADVQW